MHYRIGASSMDEAGYAKPVLWDNLEGCGGEGGGRGLRMGEITCIHHGRFMLMYGKNHHNIAK